MSVGTVYDRAYKGDFNQVKVKLDQEPTLIDKADPNDRLLIHWASLGGNENLVEYLIDSGSPVDPLDDTNSTPLILAASAGRFEVVRLLIGRGANVNHKSTRSGQSALQYACSKGHKEIAKLLMKSDADINHVDNFGATPLHRAAAQGRNEIVELLLSCPDIKVDAVDCTGSTPLHLACEEDREITAVMLMKAKANFDALNKAEKTPSDLCSTKLKNTLNNLLN